MFSVIFRAKAGVQARLAGVMRRFDGRVLIIIGLFSTSYAIFLFAVDNFSTKQQNATSDAILKFRLSGPKPADDILIVDIDERSLAIVSNTHGNWPWPRSVLADGLQQLADLGARAVLFNVMMSDKDLRHPDSDAALEITTALIEPVAFPLIRLNPKNDTASELDARSLHGVAFASSSNDPVPFAAIIPIFKTMHDRLGVSNQLPDQDGIIRRYPYVWSEHLFSIPSIVKRTLMVSGLELKDRPFEMTLNWRNKNGRYRRISFSDAMQLDPNSDAGKRLKNAIIVLGVSAPGIGQIKPTAVASIEDDNEILATALDDALNGTYFRVVPPWASLAITVILVWLLVLLAAGRVPSEKINRVFALLQVGLAVIMLVLASYSTILVDLTMSMSFVLIVFGAIKLVRRMSDSNAGAKPGYRTADVDPTARTLMLVGFRRKFVGLKTALRWEHEVQRTAGMRQVIRIDDLFGGNSFLSDYFSDYEAIIVLTQTSQRNDLVEIFQMENFSLVKLSFKELEEHTDIGSETFRSLVAGLLIRNAAEVYAI